MRNDNKNTLQQMKKNINLWWEIHQNEFFLLALFILLSAIFFGAGRLLFAGFYEPARRSGGQARGIIIEENAFPVRPKQGLGQAMPIGRQARFMASVNGEKYYPVGCKAANRINKENSLWFASEKEAHEMGYTPSSQCEK